MTHTDVQPPMPRVRPTRRWRRWVALGIVVAVLGAIGVYTYLEYAHERGLEDAIAEADRLDPGWRLPALEAARAIVPDEENGALVVRAARALMPARWPTPPVNGAPHLVERLMRLTPREPLADADANELHSELAKVAAARDKARTLADRPWGRYRVAWTDSLIDTLMPHIDEVHTVVALLTLDALSRCLDGDTDDAVRSCQAALNGARSLGDEPAAVAQWHRAFSSARAVQALERVLARGTARPEVLAEMQGLLAQEAVAPWLLIAARADRVAEFQALDAMRTGKFNRAGLMLQSSKLGPTFDGMVERGRARTCEAAFLRFGTAVVEIAKLPSEAQLERFKALTEPVQRRPPILEALSGGRPIDWAKRAAGLHESQAELRCATAAIAAERYRLAEHRWPATLDDLGPRYLAAVPRDPFDGRSLRLRRLPDGLVIYSLGSEGIDHDGQLIRPHPAEPGHNVGFRLWDGDQRD